MTEYQAEIGVFGGSGFYSFVEDVKEVKIDTPYGPPSDKIALAEISGRKVAFLPRHGKDHTIPPHKINYRANLWAMKSLGVKAIMAPTAVGSLQKNIKRGDFVVVDQFVDRTRGRIDTFYDGPVVTHISTADPYCPVLRELAIKIGKEQGVTVHETGTVVVIQGPRFSTKSESRWFTQSGWDVINMTQYPEVTLARELEIHYVNIALITDYDAGLEGEPGIEPVTADDVVRVMNSNNERVKKLILSMIEKMPKEFTCGCDHVLEFSRM